MEPEIDKRSGKIITKEIEGFRAEKYGMRTEFTMTKYKITPQDVMMIKEC
jgi:hypothetical protein